MSKKRRGQLTVSGEWARHLRPVLRRAFWKGERQAERVHVRDAREATMEPADDRECVHSRLIEAPRERLFRALADPRHLARWWGPEGFSSTFDTFEFRPGGTWRFVMHGPDGTDYPNENVFREIVVPERVVVEHVSKDHHFVLTITFAARGDQTLVGWRQVFDTAAHREQVAAVVGKANEQNLDRLAAEVRIIA
jgi:uncharacterized protein YndB with AHSA1/START domain